LVPCTNASGEGKKLPLHKNAVEGSFAPAQLLQPLADRRNPPQPFRVLADGHDDADPPHALGLAVSQTLLASANEVIE
jgi:hypothetical protein